MDKMKQTLVSNWNLIFQFAVWGYNIVTQFLKPPPSSALACSPDVTDCQSATEYLAKYGLAVTIGLAMIATWWLRKRRHTLIWIALTILALVGAYSSNVYYQRLQHDWICAAVIKGKPVLLLMSEHLTEDAEAKKADPNCGENPERPSCVGLLSCFENKPEQIWLSDEVNDRRLYLTALYFSVLPLYALGIIFLSQAIYCATQKGAREQFRGRWISEEVSENTRPIELHIRVANKRISGVLLNLNDLDPPAISEAKVKRDTLTFVHGRNRINYEMNLVNDAEASLTQKYIEKPKSWHLLKTTES